MLLKARAASRLALRRGLSTAIAPLEFTIAPYAARPDSVGTGRFRGNSACILTLSHPGFTTIDERKLRRLYGGSEEDDELYLSRELHTLEPSLSGMRAYSWVDRDSPAESVASTLRRISWQPDGRVVEAAVLRSASDALDPSQMEPLAGVQAAQIAELAKESRVVVRLTAAAADGVACDELYVPLRGLPENHVESSFRFERRHCFEQDRPALSLIGAAIAVGAAGALGALVQAPMF